MNAFNFDQVLQRIWIQPLSLCKSPAELGIGAQSTALTRRWTKMTATQ